MKNADLQQEVRAWYDQLDPHMKGVLEGSYRQGELDNPKAQVKQGLSAKNLKIRRYLYHILQEVEKTSDMTAAFRPHHSRKLSDFRSS